MIERGSQHVDEIGILGKAAIDGNRSRERCHLRERGDGCSGVERDPFEKRLAHIGAVAVEREADPETRGAAVPIRTGKPGKSGNEDEAAIDRGRALKTLEAAVAGKAEAPEPIDGRSRVMD